MIIFFSSARKRNADEQKKNSEWRENRIRLNRFNSSWSGLLLKFSTKFIHSSRRIEKLHKKHAEHKKIIFTSNYGTADRLWQWFSHNRALPAWRGPQGDEGEHASKGRRHWGWKKLFYRSIDCCEVSKMKNMKWNFIDSRYNILGRRTSFPMRPHRRASSMACNSKSCQLSTFALRKITPSSI